MVWEWIHKLLRRADARGSANISVYDAYRYFADQALLTPQST